jgi:hypothetical protein
MLIGNNSNVKIYRGTPEKTRVQPKVLEERQSLQPDKVDILSFDLCLAESDRAGKKFIDDLKGGKTEQKEAIQEDKIHLRPEEMTRLIVDTMKDPDILSFDLCLAESDRAGKKFIDDLKGGKTEQKEAIQEDKIHLRPEEMTRLIVDTMKDPGKVQEFIETAGTESDRYGKKWSFMKPSNDLPTSDRQHYTTWTDAGNSGSYSIQGQSLPSALPSAINGFSDDWLIAK